MILGPDQQCDNWVSDTPCAPTHHMCRGVQQLTAGRVCAQDRVAVECDDTAAGSPRHSATSTPVNKPAAVVTTAPDTEHASTGFATSHASWQHACRLDSAGWSGTPFPATPLPTIPVSSLLGLGRCRLVYV